MTHFEITDRNDIGAYLNAMKTVLLIDGEISVTFGGRHNGSNLYRFSFNFLRDDEDETILTRDDEEYYKAIHQLKQDDAYDFFNSLNARFLVEIFNNRDERLQWRAFNLEELEDYLCVTFAG